MPSLKKSSEFPLILGIDPGYDRLGWAVGQISKKGRGEPDIKDLGCIITSRKNTITQRYLTLDSELQKIIDEYRPQQLAIEGLFFSKNKTTALKVAEARGVILSCAARNKLEIFEYFPNQIKLAVTGNGRANKVAMEKMLRLQLILPIKKKDKKIIDDAMDAVGVVLTHTLTGPRP